MESKKEFRVYYEFEGEIRIWSMNLKKEDKRVSFPTITTEGKILAVCQNTGQPDKNGDEIYEGDIIKTVNGNFGMIVYKAPFFEVTASEDQSSMYSREWFLDAEIVGNIYLDPNFFKELD